MTLRYMGWCHNVSLIDLDFNSLPEANPTAPKAMNCPIDAPEAGVDARPMLALKRNRSERPFSQGQTRLEVCEERSVDIVQPHR